MIPEPFLNQQPMKCFGDLLRRIAEHPATPRAKHDRMIPIPYPRKQHSPKPLMNNIIEFLLRKRACAAIPIRRRHCDDATAKRRRQERTGSIPKASSRYMPYSSGTRPYRPGTHQSSPVREHKHAPHHDCPEKRASHSRHIPAPS